MYADLEKQVLCSANPFDKALQLAIAGNIIDFAVSEKNDL